MIGDDERFDAQREVDGVDVFERGGQEGLPRREEGGGEGLSWAGVPCGGAGGMAT